MALLIRVECLECENELKASMERCKGSEDAIIMVLPCETCMSSAYDEGFKDISQINSQAG